MIVYHGSYCCVQHPEIRHSRKKLDFGQGFNTIELYLDRLIDKKEALKRLKYYKPNEQICIINQEILNECLSFVECTEV